MILKYPWLLLLFLTYIPLIWWYIRRRNNSYPWLGISSLVPFESISVGWKGRAIKFCFFLQLAALGCNIVALTRPQSYNSRSSSTIEGTDIVLAIDISTSMAAQDIAPNRFLAAKKIASEFVGGRTDDNIGVVAFGGVSLSLVPLSYDKISVISAINNIEMGQLDNGTAIGDGLTSAINRLIAGKAKSKSIILLTDGTNNTGDVAPATAADIAKSKNIRVYTIGVGTDQAVQITDPYGFSSTTLESKIDEQSLKEIASVTGGKYFRAKDARTLKNVFNEIDNLEKSRMDVNKYTRMDERTFPWILGALGCMMAMIVLRHFILRRIP